MIFWFKFLIEKVESIKSFSFNSSLLTSQIISEDDKIKYLWIGSIFFANSRSKTLLR